MGGTRPNGLLTRPIDPPPPQKIWAAARAMEEEEELWRPEMFPDYIAYSLLVSHIVQKSLHGEREGGGEAGPVTPRWRGAPGASRRVAPAHPRPPARTLAPHPPWPAVGGVISVPICAAAALARPQYRSLPAALGLAGKVSAGAALLLPLTAAPKLVTSVDRDGVNDRLFRLHYNAGLNRMDRLAGVGGLAGVAAAGWASGVLGGAALAPGAVYQLVGGLGLGAAAGVGLHFATRPASMRKSVAAQVESVAKEM